MTRNTDDMNKKTAHDTKVIVECQQEGTLKKIVERIDHTDKRIEIMQTGFGEMVKEVCDKVDKLADNFNNAMFPTPLHPNNGIINNVKNISEDMAVVKTRIKEYDKANLLIDVPAVQKEIQKFKVQLSTIAAIAGGLMLLIEFYFKIKG